MVHKSITFFHNSTYDWRDKPSLFKPRLRDENKLADKYPAFYWFNDYWHSNFPAWREKYFYFFVKNPKIDNIKFRARHGEGSFHDLYYYYASYLEARNGNSAGASLYRDGNYKGYLEPSILKSYDEVSPDFVLYFENEKDRIGAIVKPDNLKGKKVALFDENYRPTKFTDIPEIIEAVPQIVDSLPFTVPEKIDSSYFYENWVQYYGAI